MIYKFNFSASGNKFYPEAIVNKVQGNFIIDNLFNPEDKKPVFKTDKYNFGNISFWHNKKFSTENELVNYENDFIDFIYINHTLFIENGVTEFEIFIEIYFDGGQCNFEIFNKKILKFIGEFGISLPISVYVLSEDEIKKWEEEITLSWKSQ